MIVSLARVRLEPPPHLAFGLAGTSPPDRFYTFASPTLAYVRARPYSLARSYRSVRFCTRAVPPRPRRSIFFFSFLRTWWSRALSMRGDTIHGCSKRKDEREAEGRALSPVDVCRTDRIAIDPVPPVSRIQEMRAPITEARYLLMTAWWSLGSVVSLLSRGFRGTPWHANFYSRRAQAGKGILILSFASDNDSWMWLGRHIHHTFTISLFGNG